jgi:hypothetical protein
MSPTLEAAASRLSLTVSTSDSQSEIVVLDSRGRPEQRGFGPQRTFELEPGIYRVKVLTGTEFQEKSVVLTEPRSEPLQFAQIAFASPAPLAGTSTSHEYHIEAADKESKVTHVTDGTGSSLFFLVRDWTPTAVEAARPRVTGNPAEGLSLYAVSAAGERKICDLATAGTRSNWGDPWAACTIEVTPAVYELRLELPGGETLHQSVVASANWQTQSFLFMRAYSSDTSPQWRADLSRTSVLLSQTRGFAPNESMLRIAELARVALATKGPGERGQTNRRLMPEEMRTLLRGKFENPMLGMYSAHLLLLEASVDLELLREVVRNLRGMLGLQHPDVEALALRAVGEPPPLPFEHPPMLSRSWSLILEASVTRPDVVTDALAKRNTGKFLREGPWHIRGSPSEAGTTDGKPDALELSDVETALAESLGIMKHIRRMSQPSTTQFGHARPEPTVTRGLPRQEAVAERNESQWCFAWPAGRKSTSAADRAALVREAKWRPGEIITVSFLDGDPAVQQRVKDVALQWVGPGMADLKLDFRQEPNTLIRISFSFSGSWSTIGTTCRQVTNPAEPTMNYGWLDPSSSDAEVERVVLHEFGHALGLIHEHPTPGGRIAWNRNVVIRDLSGPPNNWPLEVIEHNMFEPYNQDETNFTALDPQSIMVHPIPMLWTLDGFSVGWNSRLSAQDKAFIRRLYPGAPDLDAAPVSGVDYQIRQPTVPENVEVEVDAAQLHSIVMRFGIPATQLKQMLTTLEDKWTHSPDAPNLKVLLK